MSENVKFIYTVKEDMPKGTIIIADGQFVFPEDRDTTRHHIGVTERDLKAGEVVVYDRHQDTPDISHDVFKKGNKYPKFNPMYTKRGMKNQ